MRRTLLRGGAAAALLAPLAGCGTQERGDSAAQSPLPLAQPLPAFSFAEVPITTADTITVPPGHRAQVIAPWGDPVGVPGQMPAFRRDGSNTAAEQALQFGMHHDGMHYLPLDGSRRGLLVMNHEYVDNGLLFADGAANWSAEKVAKAQAAHGVSVCEVAQQDSPQAGQPGDWAVVAPSRYARRITTRTPMRLSGPAAGHALLRTAADPAGTRVLGTLNNCASGLTPWGTYLTCEENWAFYFRGPATPDAHQARWGLRAGDAAGAGWYLHDERFDAERHPNEFNRFGWVVEIDPLDPGSTPVKRTAMGRAAREGATTVLTRDRRAVVYMGEDARFEYIYRFVSRDPVRPGGAAANASLLDHGTLSVARFDADGRGRWLPLVHGQGPLSAANGFADQAEVLVKTRQAADLLGATKMDRPEWTAVDPQGWVYCTLTNNSQRGAEGRPGTDAANPRANNTTGHIIRWKEDGDHDGDSFQWHHFVLAGDATNERAEARGTVQGSAFACPDGLWVDGRGVLWIQTDMSSSAMGKGDLARLGNNQMLAANPATGQVRRFLVGPPGCEITGGTTTPDGRTMFINAQHPGETPSEQTNPANPQRYSRWPEQRADGRPRSATVVIRRDDGGVVGT